MKEKSSPLSSFYTLLDTGQGKKLEAFGPMVLIRPTSLALWEPAYPNLWEKAHGELLRQSSGQGIWKVHSKDYWPSSWTINFHGYNLILKTTSFGHVGLFPEHQKLQEFFNNLTSQDTVLNLFAYTGLASLMATKKGASVVHLDASAPTLTWAKMNGDLLSFSPKIRWILDDASKFAAKEKKHGRRYTRIILDPPTFGRSGRKTWKIEEDLIPLLKILVDILAPGGQLWMSCHTPGFTPKLLSSFLQEMGLKLISSEELGLQDKKGRFLPSGSYAWGEKEKI